MLDIHKLLRKAALVLFSAFFLSCENDTSIGLEFNPQAAFFTDTLAINASTYLMDSVITSGQNFGLIGKAVDPAFGTIEASLFVQPRLIQNPQTGEDIAFDTENTIISDSAVIRLWNRSLVYYGDSNAVATINIHRLSSTLQSKNYTNDEEVPYDPIPLGSLSFTLSDLRGIDDSVATILPVNFKLPQSILNEITEIEGTIDAETQSAFKEKFNGFAFVPAPESLNIFSFNLGASDRTLQSPPPVSSMLFYYHVDGDSTTRFYEFEFADTRYSRILTDRSGSDLAGLTSLRDEVSSTDTGGKLFVQSSTGVVPRLTFPGIEPLRNKASIAQADIIFEVDTTFFINEFPNSPLLVPIELNPDGTTRRDNPLGYSYIGNSVNDISGALGVYDDSLKTIRLDITPYIRDLVLKNRQDAGIVFASASLIPGTDVLTSGLIFNAGLNRSILRNPKLELYFSE